MSSPILHLFGGLAQGLGGTALQLEQEARAREDQKRQQSLSVLHGAFQQAAERGDNEKAATTLEMMKPLLGGKEGKPHYLDPMIGAIRNATPVTTKAPSQSAQEAQADINKTQSETSSAAPYAPGIGYVGPSQQQLDLQGATRPRTAIEDKVLQKGYFPTPEEVSQRQLGMKVAEQKALLPGELQKFGAERQILGDVYRQNQGFVIGQKKAATIDEINAREGAKSEYAKYLMSVTNGDPANATPEQQAQAQAHARDFYDSQVQRNQANAKMNEARAAEYATKHQDRVAKMAQDQKRIDAQIGNYNSLADYRKWQQSHGNTMAGLKASQIQAQYGAGRAATDRLKDIQKKRGELIPQLKQAQAIAANPLSDPETRAKAQGQVEVLERQYSEFEKQANDELQKLETSQISTPDLGTKTSGKPPTKVLGKPDSKTDPMGIR